ncbi:hypothetical protein ACW5EG_02270 [Luteimonas sp. A611]
MALAATSGTPASAGHEASERTDDAAAAHGDRHQIIAQLEQALRATAPAGDDQDLDFVIEQMRKAVAAADLRPEPSAMERAPWVDTLEALASEGLLAVEERESLIRQFGEASDVLQTREAQVALELAERIERDGEHAAMAWLASLRPGNLQAPRVGGTVDTNAVLPGKQSITRSRSRRLRGPPGSV